MTRALVAAPWGNPFGWGLARYVFEGHGDVQDARVEVTSRTSLEAVVRGFNADTALVVIADTVAVAPKRGSGNECEGVEGPLNLDELSSYKKLIKKAKTRVETWIRNCSGAETLAEMLNRGLLEIEVVPGLGVYGGWRFGSVDYVRGNSLNPIKSYGGEVFHVLLRKLVEVKPEALVIDLTHGINYMPVAFYEVARLAVTAYAVAEASSTELIFTNSEPYPRGGTGEPVLNVYVVGRERIEATTAAEKASVWVDSYVRGSGNVRVRPLRVANPDLARQGLGRNLGEAERKLAREVDLGVVAARAILYSMPLVVFYIVMSAGQNVFRDLLDLLKNLRSTRNEATIIDKARKEIRLPLLYSMEDTVFLAFTTALQSYLKRVVEDIRLADLNVEKDGVPLRMLESVVERLGGTYRVIAENELNNIIKKCLDPRGDCLFPLLIHRWPNSECDRKAQASMDPRNLRAHAGLERNIVEAKIAADDLYLRYRSKCWDHLRRLLAKPKP